MFSIKFLFKYMSILYILFLLGQITQIFVILVSDRPRVLVF